MNLPPLPVVVIGAGPVGLAAAAQLHARKIPFRLLEAGPGVAANVKSWSQVRVFSPWKYNIDKEAAKLLSKKGWQQPDEEALPTGAELIRDYLQPLANLLAIDGRVHYNCQVTGISRKGMDKMKSAGREQQPFVIQVLENGVQKVYEAAAVIDASGTWQHPNPIGSGGLPALGETTFSQYIHYGIPDILGTERERYANKKVLVVGSGHSALNSLFELDVLKAAYPLTEIHWALRKTRLQDVYGGGASDALPARGALGIRIEKLVREERLQVYTPFQITAIQEENAALTLIGLQNGALAALRGMEEIIVNAGSRPDFNFLRELRIETDPAVESVAALAPLIDPNLHSCGTVRAHGAKELRQPEPDFYIVGSKSYGRAPTFLMATGYEQVRSVVAALAGDWEAATRVELDLPETGVCKVDTAGAACCA